MAPVPFRRVAGQCWLLKSEPDVYPLAQLKKDGRSAWEGVRNYQARNFMRDSMQVGDRVLFYHSGGDAPGVAGVARISQTGVVDALQFDPKSEYHDPKSKKEAPTWICVEVEFVAAFKTPIGLEQIKAARELDGILVAKRGQRLSVQPVDPAHYDWLVKAGG